MSPWAGWSWNGRHQAKLRIESSELGSLFDCVAVPFSRWALVGQTLTGAECTCRSGTLQPKSLMQRKKMTSDAPPRGSNPADPVNTRANSSGRDGRGSRAPSIIVGHVVWCKGTSLHRRPMTAR